MSTLKHTHTVKIRELVWCETTHAVTLPADADREEMTEEDWIDAVANAHGAVAVQIDVHEIVGHEDGITEVMTIDGERFDDPTLY